MNINTATPEVISAYEKSVNIAQARNFTSRLRVHTSMGTAKGELGAGNAKLSEPIWSTTSRYFLLRGAVHYERVYTQIDALLERQPTTNLVKVIWQDRY